MKDQSEGGESVPAGQWNRGGADKEKDTGWGVDGEVEEVKESCYSAKTCCWRKVSALRGQMMRLNYCYA